MCFFHKSLSYRTSFGSGKPRSISYLFIYLGTSSVNTTIFVPRNTPGSETPSFPGILPEEVELFRDLFAKLKFGISKNHHVNQWLFLVPVKGGRWQIIPELAGKIPLIYHL